MDIVGAAVDGASIRWLPYLDEGLSDSSQVDELFNEAGTATRQALARSAQNLTTLRCIACSDYIHNKAAYGPCVRCGGCLCDECKDQGEESRHLQARCLSRVHSTREEI
jgi:hypothetical protein